jgi:hypothetical protein
MPAPRRAAAERLRWRARLVRTPPGVTCVFGDLVRVRVRAGIAAGVCMRAAFLRVAAARPPAMRPRAAANCCCSSWRVPASSWRAICCLVLSRSDPSGFSNPASSARDRALARFARTSVPRPASAATLAVLLALARLRRDCRSFPARALPAVTSCLKSSTLPVCSQLKYSLVASVVTARSCLPVDSDVQPALVSSNTCRTLARSLRYTG